MPKFTLGVSFMQTHQEKHYIVSLATRKETPEILKKFTAADQYFSEMAQQALVKLEPYFASCDEQGLPSPVPGEGARQGG